MKKVSVLVPVYNVEKFLEKCLRSLFSNSIANNCEFIFVNDCSTDNSLSVLQKIVLEYRNLTIKIISNEENKGVAYSRNVLLENAEGKYIAFVDSDDWIESTYIEKMLIIAEQYNYDVVGCWRYDDYDCKHVFSADPFANTGKENLDLLLQGKIYNCLHCRLIKHSIITDNKIVFNVGNNMGEDGLFCAKVYSYSDKTSVIPEYLYHYVHYNTNSLCANNNHNHWKQRLNNVLDTINYLESIKYNKDENILLLQARFNLLAIISTDKAIRMQYGNYFKNVEHYMYTVSSSKYAKIYIWCYLHKMSFLCKIFRDIKYKN